MSEYTEIFGRRIKDLTTPSIDLNKTSELVGNIKLPAGNFPTELSGCEGLRLIDLKNYVYTPVDPEIYTEITKISEDLAQSKIFLNEKIIAEEQRAILEESKLADDLRETENIINSKINTVESNLEVKIGAVGVGNKAYTTYALMDADKANIPANSKVTVTNDETESNNGDWQWNGTTFTKSVHDPVTQSRQYTDTKVGLAVMDINKVNLDAQAAVFGKYTNFNKNMVQGYISKSTGALVSNTGWYATPYIAVRASSIVARQGTLVPAGSSAAALALYDQNLNFLGVYTDTTAAFQVKVSDINPAARYVRLSIQAAIISTAVINVFETNYFISDFFLGANLSAGYVTPTGNFVVSSTWATTPLVPVKLGMEFTYSGYGNVGVVSGVSEYDINGTFLRSVYSVTGISNYVHTITSPDVAFVRASAATTSPRVFRGFQLPTNTSKKYSVYAPTELYALKGETLYVYADGIVGEDYDVAWNLSTSNKLALPVTPSTDADVNIQLTTRNEQNERITLAQFPIKVTDTPVSPTTKRYVLPIGDSLTEGVSQSGIQGAWVNECSRRLTGVGRAILGADPQVSPAPLNLTNIEFIGTLGDEVVKHEGRGGWRASHYLNNASLGSHTNAFWNPNTSKFDMNFYLASNNFTGVAADGSNLTVTLLLGWNDVYNSNAKQAALDVGALIDAIKATHPQTHFIVLGLNQAPAVNYKTFVGARFVSRREVFEAIKSFGDTYKEMVATKTNTQFLQISATFNSTVGYQLQSFRTSARVVTNSYGCYDHVHPNAIGYAHIADAVYYAFLYRYCR